MRLEEAKLEIERKLKEMVDRDAKIPNAYLLVHSDRHAIHWSLAHGGSDDMPAPKVAHR